MLALHEYRAILCPVILDAVPTGKANVQRGLAALDKAMKGKTTVHRAMYREGLGWVDFVWGDEGAPPNSRGVRRGAKGLAHALESRRRKDGYDHHQTAALLRRMVYAIAEGRELDRHEIGRATRVIVGQDGTEVHLVKLTGGNAWTLTVFAR